MTGMNTSSGNEIMQQDEAGKFQNWVDSFLEKIFFERCESHEDMQKNELNKYCINCDTPICGYCIRSGEHYNHNNLTIYKVVYQNVVPLSEMKDYIDCDKIQPYKCNKKWVVSLTPLPHNGPGSLIEGDGACCLCKRKLTNPDCFHYCSIESKVQTDVGEGRVEFYVKPKVMQKPNRKCRRKGVPHRVPF